jgi:hypothetical protein
MSEKPLREGDMVSFFACALEEDFACEAEAVGTARATSPEAQQAGSYARATFGDNANPNRQVLQQAADAYKTQMGVDSISSGAEWRRFLESSGAYSKALEVLDDAGKALSGFQAMGVVDEEFQSFKANRLREIAPDGISLENFDEAVQAGMTAWPTLPGVRIAASDRFYLFKGMEPSRIYLLERVEEAP